MPVSRRRLLGLGAALSLAGLGVMLPGTAVIADSPPPLLPDSVAQALRTLTNLGFDEVVGVYRTLRPTIEIQPLDILSSGGLTQWWSNNRAMSASISLRADLEGSPPTFAAILAHELLHVWQFAYQPEADGSCLNREVPAYRLEAAVLRAWATANPLERYGLPVFSMELMSVVEQGYPVDLETFASQSSCGSR
jgi:hypothetical protein